MTKTFSKQGDVWPIYRTSHRPITFKTPPALSFLFCLKRQTHRHIAEMSVVQTYFARLHSKTVYWQKVRARTRSSIRFRVEIQNISTKYCTMPNFNEKSSHRTLSKALDFGISTFQANVACNLIWTAFVPCKSGEYKLVPHWNWKRNLSERSNSVCRTDWISHHCRRFAPGGGLIQLMPIGYVEY